MNMMSNDIRHSITAQWFRSKKSETDMTASSLGKCFKFPVIKTAPQYFATSAVLQHNSLTIVLQLVYTVCGGDRMDFYTVRDMLLPSKRRPA